MCFIWDTARNELVSFYPGWQAAEGGNETGAESAKWCQDPVPHQEYTGTSDPPCKAASASAAKPAHSRVMPYLFCQLFKLYYLRLNGIPTMALC